MDTKELISKVRKVEIKSKGLSNHIFSGEYHTAFKGRGMSFSEVREYAYGDDIRNIDWNVTARFHTPFVKVYEEERELTVMLLVDISPSAFIGTVQDTKSSIIAEICAVLSFAAINNNDKVGLILFSDQVHKYIPPKKGKSNILRIIRELVSVQPQGNVTNIAGALDFFNNVVKKKSISFVLSDFFALNYADALRHAARKHDVIGIKFYDKIDEKLPDIGLVPLKDSETGNIVWVDTADKNIQKSHTAGFREKDQYYKTAFLKAGADILSIRTDLSYIQPLNQFFKNRA